jgi:hypothetical protein
MKGRVGKLIGRFFLVTAKDSMNGMNDDFDGRGLRRRVTMFMMPINE